MLEWQDYISKLLDEPCSFDSISLAFGDGDGVEPIAVPPIIKASVAMLDRMLAHQSSCNIFVFPERIQFIFIFTLTVLLHNIFDGKIERAYDPEAFVPGEKLRLGKAVVEFVRIEEHKGHKYMRIRLADLENIAPIEWFPIFQKTTAQRLSKDKQFSEEKKAAKKKLDEMNSTAVNIEQLADYKTHMESSIVNMTSVINAKELISQCRLNGQKIKDMILIGQANYQGEVKNIGAGQLGGIPAIALASDLYSIVEMAERGHPIQSIIIDGSNASSLLTQMDALDQLIHLGVPITCVTDTVNSFDLQPFLDRQFNLWRWDENSITDKLYDASHLNADKKVKCCATRNVEYLSVDGHEISVAIQRLSLHKGEALTMSVQMSKIFDDLNSLAFLALRETVPFNNSQLSWAHATLERSSTALSKEKAFLAPEIAEDYSEVIRCLEAVFARSYTLQKFELMKKKLLTEHYESVCIIVPERADKVQIEHYWKSWCHRRGLKTRISILCPGEYHSIQCGEFSATIVVGWLQRAVMQRILYSFNTQNYVIFLYDYEKQWQKHTVARWRSALDSARNRKNVEQVFATDTLHISTNRFKPVHQKVDDVPQEDELAKIETALRENKYRRYEASGGQKATVETVEAIPINFVGGYLAFYRVHHKVISASDIIMNDGAEIKSVFPDELKMGDFVVIREADRDLIKEIADMILERERNPEARNLATKWKEALTIETTFCSLEDIYKRLQDVGCEKGYQTVRSWTEEDVICPSDKDDLRHIATITGNEVLNELLDQIFDAAQVVRSAHIKAGKVLSQKLRVQIAGEIKKCGDIDPFNIWEPIEMPLEGIGMVRVLKIIDIGSKVVINLSDADRLLDEE